LLFSSDLAFSEVLPMNTNRYSAYIHEVHDNLLATFGDQWRNNGVKIGR
jgi:hypothetical protein